MTLTEKILAKHSDNTRLQPGANIWTNVDKLLTHDVCGPGTFGIFEKEFGAGAQVWDPEKVIIIPDHYIFTSDPRANRNVDILRQALHGPHMHVIGMSKCCMSNTIVIMHFHITAASAWLEASVRPACMQLLPAKVSNTTKGYWQYS